MYLLRLCMHFAIKFCETNFLYENLYTTTVFNLSDYFIDYTLSIISENRLWKKPRFSITNIILSIVLATKQWYMWRPIKQWYMCRLRFKKKHSLITLTSASTSYLYYERIAVYFFYMITICIIHILYLFIGFYLRRGRRKQV